MMLLFACVAKAQSIRLLSYNIHHARNESGVMDVEGLADFINKYHPDVVAMQEVDSMCARSGNLNLAAQLGQLTGMYYYFGKAMDYDGGGYGEAILSRLPVESIATVALPIQPDKGREPRAAIEAVLRLSNGKRFKFLATHLDHLEDDTDRLMQTKFISDRYAHEPLPFIIAGDMNAQPNDRAMGPLFSLANQPGQDKNLPTWPSGAPTHKIDYFLLSKNYDWKCTKFEVLAEKHISDHRPVIVELKKL